jgi:hypothetical protein
MRLLALLCVLTFTAPILACDRSLCVNGCHSRACKALTCGDLCASGPKCQGCWKVKAGI